MKAIAPQNDGQCVCACLLRGGGVFVEGGCLLMLRWRPQKK
jgi:hypothetical protein